MDHVPSGPRDGAAAGATQCRRREGAAHEVLEVFKVHATSPRTPNTPMHICRRMYTWTHTRTDMDAVGAYGQDSQRVAGHFFSIPLQLNSDVIAAFHSCHAADVNPIPAICDQRCGCHWSRICQKQNLLPFSASGTPPPKADIREVFLAGMFKQLKL